MSDDLIIPTTPVYRNGRSRRGADPMTRRLMLIGGGLAGSLLVIVAVWSSVGRHHGPVPVVQADQDPVRVKPDHPGGMQIPGLSADTAATDGSNQADKLDPTPEAPNPQALAAQMRATPAPISRATSPLPAPATGAASLHASAPNPTTAKPARIAATTVPERNAATIVPALGAATMVPPRGSTAMPPTHGAPATTASDSHLAAGSAGNQAAPIAEHRPATTPGQSQTGRAQVQLAAVASETAARSEWDKLAHRMPEVLGARRPMFSKVEHDGHTLWRVRTGTFTTEAEANQFCREVRAKGAGCAVASF